MFLLEFLILGNWKSSKLKIYVQLFIFHKNFMLNIQTYYIDFWFVYLQRFQFVLH